LVKALLQTFRPHQWVKNLFVLAGLVFAKELFDLTLALRALAAVAIFCLLASAVYTINDILDVDKDRLHPTKCERPIPSGLLTTRIAAAAAVGLISLSLVGAGFLGVAFATTASAYLLLNLAYSVRLKEVAFLDVACISTGFVMRVLGGSFAVRVPPSFYLVACTFLLALFLALGKRRHELGQAGRVSLQRVVLDKYDARTVQWALTLTGAATFVVYSLYTLDGQTRFFFGTPYLPMTIPFTALGILRFLFLVARSPMAESPTEEMLRDVPFMANLAVWGAAIVVIVYFF
jgi:4-hydroxybenzoate polyprenyltransferase